MNFDLVYDRQSGFVRNRYENNISDRRYNGRRVKDGESATEKEVAEQCFSLDGDWCWDADPFQVTEETKAMVMRNICFLLNSFLHCTAYENIIFCWVMHEQSIIDEIIDRLDTGDARVIKISLMIDETNLRKRLSADIARGIRSNDVIDRSVARIDMYQTLDTIKVDTVNKNVYEIVSEILTL